MESIKTRSAGGIVIGESGTIALIQRKDGDGSWMFPKGHVESTEKDEDAARREIQEETGLANLEYLDDLGEYLRPRIAKDGSDDLHEMKTIHMFLFTAPRAAALHPLHDGEIGATQWLPFQNVAATLGNKTDRFWFTSIAKRVQEAIQRD
ncbi:MAG TPA: NUDIX hydrolase [Candidatus Paceibacterota bacterium]|nr:NUDIX hydrolase [Candidatus Paceibacterota bacterium]